VRGVSERAPFLERGKGRGRWNSQTKSHCKSIGNGSEKGERHCGAEER
jgi:hypothetical protein